MLIAASPLYKQKRKPKVRAKKFVPPLATGPVLVSATYEEGSWITLTFDRAIDIGGIDWTAFVLIDAVLTGFSYRGNEGAVLVGPETVEISLAEMESVTGDAITLTATASNGIVAVDGGVAWAGVTDVALPFG